MVILIFIIGKIFLWPLKMIFKLAANSLLGGLIIFVINAVGSGLGIFIPLNILSALIVGALGIPGAVLMLILTL
ncbi:MAG: pro-sigmaK processing inhibitor BofA family protein [Firmicutes bacterium]|nr:pro-sigmaK processing inhibitor BofA family protein [Bacillota bacterium]